MRTTMPRRQGTNPSGRGLLSASAALGLLGIYLAFNRLKRQEGNLRSLADKVLWEEETEELMFGRQ